MISVIHNPLGQEHPYEQLPEERFPRQPLSGQSFTVGIVTRPPGMVKQVRVFSELTRAVQDSVPAQKMENWRPAHEEGVGAEFLERAIRIEQDVWQAQLTAPPAGQELRYWVEADGVTTEPFVLRGCHWVQGGGMEITGDATMTVSPTLSGGKLAVPSLAAIEWLHDGIRAQRVRLSFTAVPGERFYGLGERFNALDQHGQVIDIRCYEQYKNQGNAAICPCRFCCRQRDMFVGAEQPLDAV